MLTELLRHWGFSRDDALWLWGRIISAALIISSGVFDLCYWAAYVGVHLSTAAIHLIQVAATIVLWISGKQAASHLPSKEMVEAAQVARKP